MRIAVSGGGTAGHVSPVLATVDALQKKPNASIDCLYIGQAGGIEASLAAEAGLRFAAVCGGKFRRLPGAGLWRNLFQLDTLRNLRDLVLIAVGAVQCWWLLRRFRPEVVFNKAGPAGLPVGLACRALGIPMVIHEPDLIAGLNNRILSRWATAIAVGFPAKLYPNLPACKLHYTGTPVQPAMLAGTVTAATKQFHLVAKRPVIVVVGGSQGAVAVNRAVLAILPPLIAAGAQIVQVTGQGDYVPVQHAAAGQGITAADGYHLVPWLPPAELGALYRAATVVVARAGASTIAELAALAKPAIILPNHQAAAHQLANARLLAEAEAAIVLTDEQPEPLAAAITELLADDRRRHRLGQKLADYYVADAPQRLAELVRQAATTATKAKGRR